METKPPFTASGKYITERLVIRDLTIDDLENHHKLISDDSKLKDRVEYRLLKNEY